ncbi:hypothetical protein M8J76_004403 [Diaphorina citri]|nr:hypothetical protein M8J76_004403 [Diaphorina citri]
MHLEKIAFHSQTLLHIIQPHSWYRYYSHVMSFRAHVANVTADAIRNFTNLRRFFYSNWGDRPPALTKIYRGAIVPKVTYAAAIWGHTIQDRQVKSKLLTCQRYCTIAISASAATVSHAAAQVLAGEPPLHMVVSEVRARELLRIRGTTPVVHLGAEFESAPGVDLKNNDLINDTVVLS